MKVALIPMNSIVGDFTGNLDRVMDWCGKAQDLGAELVVFPELALQGYPPQDLLLRASFAKYAHEQTQKLALQIKEKGWSNLGVLVGTALESLEGSNNPLLNAALFIHGAQFEVRAKSLIPHYDIFHERRYFEPALNLDPKFRAPLNMNGKKIGVLICEDSWHDTKKFGRALYSSNPTKDLVDHGCDFLINISASPYSATQLQSRRETVAKSAKEGIIPILYVNQFGANDEILFDGDAFCASEKGDVCIESAGFSEEPLLVDLDRLPTKVDLRPREKVEENYRALLVGIRDYVAKNNFEKVLIGLSGGIDSALVAVLAVDALGADNVICLSLPSKFSSLHSMEDAEQLGTRLGCKCIRFPIKFLQGSLELALKPLFGEKERDTTEENLQARLRGIVLMAVANKFGHIVLATGNKSELAAGYSTLYGDMCGAMDPIGDLYKTEVYEMAKFINRSEERIPDRSLTKPPSAELRPDQTDQDSLPPYEELDQMLFYLIEEECSFTECRDALARNGLDVSEAVLKDVERRIWQNEF